MMKVSYKLSIKFVMNFARFSMMHNLCFLSDVVWLIVPIVTFVPTVWMEITYLHPRYTGIGIDNSWFGLNIHCSLLHLYSLSVVHTHLLLLLQSDKIKILVYESPFQILQSMINFMYQTLFTLDVSSTRISLANLPSCLNKRHKILNTLHSGSQGGILPTTPQGTAMCVICSLATNYCIDWLSDSLPN